MFKKSEFKEISAEYFEKMGLTLLSSALIGYFCSYFFFFAPDTIYWMTSTIAQVFGALLAIFIVLGFRMIEKIEDKYIQGMNVAIELGKIAKQQNVDLQMQSVETMKETQSDAQKDIKTLKKDIYFSMMIIFNLVLLSLVGMIFSQSNFRFDSLSPEQINSGISGYLFVLLGYSLYSISNLIRLVGKVFDIDFKT